MFSTMVYVFLAHRLPLRAPSTRQSPPEDMNIFKKIYIEVTNCCNLSCSFCHKSNRPKTCMKADEFAEVLLKIKGYTRFIYLHVLGEAMLHPEFDLLLQTSHRHGFQVNLSTNGTLLQNKGDLLIASPAVRQINISLHSFTQAEGPELDEYLAGILAFTRKATERQTAIWLNLRLWVMQETKEDAAGNRNEIILRRLQSFFSLPVRFAENLPPGRSLSLAPGIFLSQDRQFNWPHSQPEVLNRNGTCRGLRDHIAILVDGTVVPCCLDAEADIPLGNIHQQGLDQILAGPRACQMRTGFSHQQLIESLCRRCNYRLRFL